MAKVSTQLVLIGLDGSGSQHTGLRALTSSSLKGPRSRKRASQSAMQVIRTRDLIEVRATKTFAHQNSGGKPAHYFHAALPGKRSIKRMNAQPTIANRKLEFQLRHGRLALEFRNSSFAICNCVSATPCHYLDIFFTFSH